MAGLSISAFQGGFASVAIAGVKRVYTGATVKTSFLPRELPALLPDPIKPLDRSYSERLSIGTSGLGGVAWKRTRVFNYVCLVAAVGEDRTSAARAEQVSALVDEIENAFCDFGMDGIANLGPVSIADYGILDDALSAALPNSSSLKFHGFTIQIQVVSAYRKG